MLSRWMITERLTIRVCVVNLGAKHAAVIRIAALKNNRIISYWRKGMLLYTQKWDAAEMFRLIKEAKTSQKFARTNKEENIISAGVLMGQKRIKIQIQYYYQTMLLTT